MAESKSTRKASSESPAAEDPAYVNGRTTDGALAVMARGGAGIDIHLDRVPLREALKILDDLHIGYRRASDAEVKDAHDQVRNPPASVLQ